MTAEDRVRRGTFWGDSFIDEPVPPAVEQALRRVEEQMYDIAVAELAPLGLHPYDISAPRYRMPVFEDEVPIFAALQAKYRL